MGVKTYRQSHRLVHKASFFSGVVAQRAMSLAWKEDHVVDVRAIGRIMEIERAYDDIAGGFPADDRHFERAFEQKLGADVSWGTAERKRTGRVVARPLSEIEAAVRKSKQKPTEIEGCSEVPAEPVILELRKCGLNVARQYHHTREARKRRQEVACASPTEKSVAASR